ncbi:hypothetical protein LV779_02520 [Streptomyces thinghirensis]|nr:hypothetical protein [Streptomyces thinghirensis]
MSTTGTTVSVTTTACAPAQRQLGHRPAAHRQSRDFAQGRQVALSGTSSGQSASWSGISPGTYTVIVMRSTTAPPAPRPSSSPRRPLLQPSRSASPHPRPSASPRGVMGGLGGAVQDYGTATLVAGGALVGTGVIAAAWFLRRRQKPYRFCAVAALTSARHPAARRTPPARA